MFGKVLAATFGLAVLVGAAAAHAQSLETYYLDGTIGSHPVGVTITVKDGTTFDVGHYFYDSALTDIPLTGSINGRQVSLSAPGGETFQLTLQGAGGQGGDGSTFDTSSGLNGTWAKAGQTLPVQLGFAGATEGAPDGHMYANVTNASDASFEAMVARFLRAVLAGDKQTAAAGVAYPLRINGAHTTMIRTPAAFIAAWTTIFTPALMAQIRTAVPHEMFVHENEAMVSGGAVWFGDKGASAINEP